MILTGSWLSPPPPVAAPFQPRVQDTYLAGRSRAYTKRTHPPPLPAKRRPSFCAVSRTHFLSPAPRTGQTRSEELESNTKTRGKFNEQVRKNLRESIALGLKYHARDLRAARVSSPAASDGCDGGAGAEAETERKVGAVKVVGWACHAHFLPAWNTWKHGRSAWFCPRGFADDNPRLLVGHDSGTRSLLHLISHSTFQQKKN